MCVRVCIQTALVFSTSKLVIQPNNSTAGFEREHKSFQTKSYLYMDITCLTISINLWLHSFVWVLIGCSKETKIGDLDCKITHLESKYHMWVLLHHAKLTTMMLACSWSFIGWVDLCEKYYLHDYIETLWLCSYHLQNILLYSISSSF